jgi:hypothetical protein
MISVEPTLPPLFAARIKYWIGLSKIVGHSTETSITWLRQGNQPSSRTWGTDSIFAINYADGAGGSVSVSGGADARDAAGAAGSEAGGPYTLVTAANGGAAGFSRSEASYVGIYAVSSARATVPVSVANADGTTFMLFDGNRTLPSAPLVMQLDFGSAAWKEVSFFAASSIQLSMGGPFWSYGERCLTDIYTRGCHWFPRLLACRLLHACGQF